MRNAAQAQADQPFLPHAGSYVVVRAGTLDSVVELFSRSFALAVRRDRYDVLQIGEYLGRLNARILGEPLR